MTTKQDLIAAALSAAGAVRWQYPELSDDLREACARAMVQPDVAEVERLTREFEYAAGPYGHDLLCIAAKTALLDYVRGVMAERDALIAAHDGATKKMARDERQLFESWIVRECGPGKTKRWLNTESYENMRVNDYRTGWVACLGLISAAPQPISAADVPMPEPDSGCSHIDHLYPVWNEDQIRKYGDAREAAGYARGLKDATGNADVDCSTCQYAAPMLHEQCDGCEQTAKVFRNYKPAGWVAATLRGEVK